ncbi:MAG: hypothetical protein K2J20_03985 [Bacilli bacterium]|nr:hypothetical protein [Bacilli bacterium]
MTQEEKISRRKAILNEYNVNERYSMEYNPNPGEYEVEIESVDFKVNCNNNWYFQFVCKTLGDTKYKKMFGNYYFTEATEGPTIVDLRCLLNEYNKPTFTDDDLGDEGKILERLQSLIGEKAVLIIEDQNGFNDSKLFKEALSA